MFSVFLFFFPDTTRTYRSLIFLNPTLSFNSERRLNDVWALLSPQLHNYSVTSKQIETRVKTDWNKSLLTLQKRKKEKWKGAIFDAWEQTCLRLKSKGSSFKRRERKHFKAQEMWLLRMASEPRCPRCLQHIPGWQSLPYICGVSTHKTFSCMSRFYFNPGKWPRKVGAPNPFNSCSLMVHEKALKYYCKKVHLVQLRETVF